jgi:RNA polymerase sigma-70 factor (ECF subfamily)
MSEEQRTADETAGLLARIAQGQKAAFEQFYDAFYARVYAFALRHLRNPADAAEVLNEAMLEVWRSASRFEGRSKPLTWVFGITHHKVIDRLRRRHKEHHEEFDEELAPELADETQPSALDALARAENAEQVRRCLERLSGAHRLVVHLAFFEDLSYPEIAEIVGCPVGTVKTRMFHAKEHLKRCLAGHVEASAP